jgi:RNA polymerase sigma factor (sigma-70 family)
MAIETLGAALRQIKRLFAEGVISGLPDRRLLDLFIEERDEDAFEVLVARHGPMVLSVCRGILRDPNDAEDAFQATFLVLVKKAATIRGRQALGGWLYRVAHRVAVEANKAAARRRAGEREAGLMASATTATGPTLIDQLLSALHEEIGLLPEKHRLAVVLCDLEGMTQGQAAVELNWSERTLRRRLAEARERLKARLGRRGLAHGDALLGAVFLESRVMVPAAWQEATVRTALDILDQTVAVGSVSLAAQSLTREVLKTMFVRKLTIASAALLGAGLMAWAAAAAIISRGDEPQKAATAAVAEQAAPAPAPEPDPLDAVGTFPVRGRVLDPDGRPMTHAEIYVRHNSFDVMTAATGNSIPESRSDRVATSDADGRFHFDLDKSASDFPYRDFPVWHGAQIAAAAPGYGPAWVAAGSLLKGGEATLRLVRDDAPIRGRVVDLQGRPVAGAAVYAREILELGERGKDASLASGQVDYGQLASQYSGPVWMGQHGRWTTDADGRFEISGAGRDRVVCLEFRGPTIEKAYLHAMARESRNPPIVRPQPNRTASMTMRIGRPPAIQLVGATFEHVAGPTKPITGAVRSKAIGQPVAGVQILGTEPSTWTEVSTLTDAEGRFRLIGLPKGSFYQVRAAPRPGVDPFLGAEVNVTDTEGLKPIETKLELPRGVIVSGRLIDAATGKAVRAKHVSYFKVPGNRNEGSAGLSSSGIVDPTFRITVPPGEGMICANVRGKDLPYTRARLRPDDKGKGIGGVGDGETMTMRLDAQHAYRMIDVPAGTGSLNLDLELTRGDSRKGRLVGPTGKPVVGARYSGHSDAWAEARTLAGDTFEVLGLKSGHPRVVIFGHKELGLVGWVVLKEEDFKTEAPLVVHLRRAGSLKGRLVDEDGLPLAGVRLSVQTHYPDIEGFGPPRQGLWPEDATYTSDADGRFVIDGLRPGLKSRIYVQSKTRPGFRLDAGDVFREITSQPGEIRDLGDVKVKPEAE